MKRESSPQTIQRVLSEYDLGRKLRQLRLRKKIALADLGKHTGLSPSLLSQLENGKLIPTLPTLARIAMVFDVSLDHFFGGKRGRKLFSVVRAGERMRFPERQDAPAPAYFFECLTYASQGVGLQAFLAEFPARTKPAAGEHAHDGVEIVLVLEGTLVLSFEGEEHQLNAGDCVTLDSSAPHNYRGAGKTAARAVVVTAPPRI